jgi:hypothetical protein
MATKRTKRVEKRSMSESHLETIIDLRRRGLSWSNVAAELREVGLAATTQNVWKWFRRRQRRASRVARELRPFDQLKHTSSAAIGSIENPANTAGEAEAAVERLTTRKPEDEFRPHPVRRQSAVKPPLSDRPGKDTFVVGDDILK